MAFDLFHHFYLHTELLFGFDFSFAASLLILAVNVCLIVLFLLLLELEALDYLLEFHSVLGRCQYLVKIWQFYVWIFKPKFMQHFMGLYFNLEFFLTIFSIYGSVIII